MANSYAREKLGAAVYSLATGADTIQRRLVNAFVSMIALGAGDFEGEQLENWTSIHNRATAQTSGPFDGSLQNTLWPMSDDDAVRLAKDIVELESMVALEAEFKIN